MNNFLEELGLVEQIKEYSSRYFAQEISHDEALKAARILVENLVVEYQDELSSIQVALSTLISNA